MKDKEWEEWYVILNMNCEYEICRMCPKSGLFKGSYEECEKWIEQKMKEEMKDEEMADKHAEEYVMREDVITENDKVPFDNGYGFQTVSFEDEVKKGYKDGFLAGLKAGRPQWHKVKDELPTNTGLYLIFYYNSFFNDKVRCIARYSPDRKEFLNLNIEDGDEVIAWCEIPTFDKE